MSDEIKSAMLGEGDVTSVRPNDSPDGLPSSSGEGDTAGPSERIGPDTVPPDHGGPAADADIESVSRTATDSLVNRTVSQDEDPGAAGQKVCGHDGSSRKTWPKTRPKNRDAGKRADT